MSLYASYLRETGLKHIHETEDGFIVYHLRGKECYIEDLYVKPEARRKKVAWNMGVEVEQKAKQHGCSYIISSINTSIPDPTTTLVGQLAFGMKVLKAEPSVLWLMKEI